MWSKDVRWMVIYIKRLGIIFKAGMKYLKGTISLKHKNSMASDNETQLLYMAYIKFHTLVIRFHMTACHLVWGHQSCRTNFLHLSSGGMLTVRFSESVGTK